MKVGELFAEMGMDFSQFDRDERVAKARVSTLGDTLSGILQGAFSFTLGIGLLQGIKSLSGLVKDFTLTAARTETLDVALQAVAHSTGASVRGLMEQRNALMDLGIAEQEASQMLTRFMQAQIDTADAAKLARVAQDSAVIAGENSSETAAKMTEAIAKQRPELLSAYGMTRNLNDIYGDYAKTIGKTTKQLSEAERKQAMLNYILEEGEKVAGTYERSMGTAGKKLGSLTRYVDTFKNAVAAPLALPAFGVIIDAATEALKRGIAWAEVNKATLQAWGQTIANLVRSAVNGFNSITEAIAKNWAAIKLAGTALLSYVVAATAVTAATSAWGVATTMLRGELRKGIPVLSGISTMIGHYRVQMALAPVATNVFTGALYRLQSALYAVNAAMGPIGWAILGISAAIGIGTSLWNKYTASLRSASTAADQTKMGDMYNQMADSAKKATENTKDQADALKEAGKASQDNVQSFDEVHTLMDDMGDVPGLDIPELDIPTPDDMAIPGFELPDDMFADFEAQLPPFGERVKGFFSWLWQEIAVPAWDFILGIPILGPALGWIAENVKKLGPVFSSVWDWISTTAVTVWTWLSGFLSTLWQGIVSVAQTVWGVVGPFFGALWEGVKTVFSAVWGVIQQVATTVWTFLVGTAQAIWGVLGPFFETLWGVVKEVFSVAWNAIQYAAVFVWTFLVETAKAIWDVLGPFFTALWEGIKAVFEWVWNTLGPWLVSAWNWLVEKGQAIWDFLKPYFEALWKAVTTIFEIIIKPLIDWVVKIWDWVKEHTLAVWNAIKEHIVDPVAAAKKDVEDLITKIKEFVSEKWTAIKEFALDVWQRIKEHIVDPILAAKDKVEEYMGNLKKSVEDIWGKVKDAVKEIKDKIYEYLIEPFQKAYDFIKDTWGKITGFFKGSGDEGKSATAGAAEKMMEGAEDYLAFHSPTRKGPGRYADKWAPNLMKMYAEGILASASLVQSAAGTAAQSLGTMASMPRLALGASSGPSVSAPVATPAPEIHLHVGTLIADDYGLKKLEQKLRNIRIYEDQRVGDAQ